MSADEVFCTGTVVIVTPVGSITYQDTRYRCHVILEKQCFFFLFPCPKFFLISIIWLNFCICDCAIAGLNTRQEKEQYVINCGQRLAGFKWVLSKTRRDGPLHLIELLLSPCAMQC